MADVLPTPVTAQVQTSVPFSLTAWESATASAGVDVVIATPTPSTGYSCCLSGIWYSYTGTTGAVVGNLAIVDSGTSKTVFSTGITGSAPVNGFIPFTPPKRTSESDSTFTITLLGNGSYVGALSLNVWQEP